MLYTQMAADGAYRETVEGVLKCEHVDFPLI